jgi:hypothetical protein
VDIRLVGAIGIAIQGSLVSIRDKACPSDRDLARAVPVLSTATRGSRESRQTAVSQNL